MFSQNIESPQFDILGDLNAVRKLGYLNDFPLAMTRRTSNVEKYHIFLGQKKVSIYDKDVLNLLDVKALLLGSAFYNRGEVHFENDRIDEWEIEITAAAKALQSDYDVKVNCTCVLRGLYILTTGNGMPISNADAFGGSFASIILDLPIAYKKGPMVICATRDGDSKTFDLEAEACRALHWWHEASLTIEPIGSGVRAVLVYDVIRNQPEPVHFLPGTHRHWVVEKQLQAHLPSHIFRKLECKTGYLPLVRMFLYSYSKARITIPPICQELCVRVIWSYEQRMKKAMEGGAGIDVLFELVEEGKDLVQSLGEGLYEMLTKRHIRELKALGTDLEDRLWQLQSANIMMLGTSACEENNI